MKTTMKFFAAITLVFGFSLANYAQTAGTANILAHAQVTSTIVVVSEQSLEFGVVTPSVDKIVNTDGTTSGTSTTGVFPGRGKITRALNQIINYNLTTSSGVLTRNSGTETMTFDTYTTAYRIGATGTFTNGNGGTTPTQVAASATDADVYVKIGATVHPLALTSNPVGTYEGSITLSAEYN